MFSPVNSDSASSVEAGALGTQDINAYQAVGAVTILGVVSGSTLGMAIAAPLPILGTVGLSAGLLYYGTKVQKDKHAERDAKSSTTSNAGFPEPQDSGAELEQPAT